jgi:hypothetical protein
MSLVGQCDRLGSVFLIPQIWPLDSDLGAGLQGTVTATR